MLANPWEREAICAIVQSAMTSPEVSFEKLVEARFSPEDFTDESARVVAEKVLETTAKGDLFIPSLAQIPAVASKLALWAADPGGVVVLRGETLTTLKNETRRLKMANTMSQLAQTLRQGKTGADAALVALEASDKTRNTMVATRAYGALLGSVSEQAAKGLSKLTPTGLEAWDTVLGGIRATLTVIGSQPGVGKSALLAGMAIRFMAIRQPVGVLSLEDEGEWLARRIVAFRANMTLGEIYNAHSSPMNLSRIQATVKKESLTKNGIWVRDMTRPKPGEVIAAATQMIHAHGLAALFVDHLGEIDVGAGDRHHLEIDNTLSEIRAVANKTNTPIVLFAHTKRREGAETDPQLTDFAFSSGVERKARLALALTRVERVMKVHILKNTEGPGRGDSFNLTFNETAGVVV